MIRMTMITMILIEIMMMIVMTMIRMTMITMIMIEIMMMLNTVMKRLIIGLLIGGVYGDHGDDDEDILVMILL